jgi:hypothetical protein
MSSVIVCGYDENRTHSHVETLRANGYEVVTRPDLNEALRQGCQLLVLGLEAIKVEDARLWGLVGKLATRIPVIGLHDNPSEDICKAAAHANVAMVLPHTAPHEVFLYAAEQLMQRH